ncbi:MAG: YhjD/YihY/BrkB family envelope integrity protein [bacterium]
MRPIRAGGTVLERYRRFVRQDIWDIPTQELSRFRVFRISVLRLIVFTVAKFREDRCTWQASALTFFTLLSIVPLLAMLFGIAKGFGLDRVLREEILQRIPPQQHDVTLRLLDYAREWLATAQGGLVAGVGVAFLFWTVIRLLGNIESSFNQIWNVKKERPLARKFSDYLSMMLIAPVLFIVSSSLTVLVRSKAEGIAEASLFLNPLVSVMLGLLSYAVSWLLFTLLYLLMPNTRVRVVSSFLGAVVAGALYQAVQWVYLTFQIGVSRLNAVYGSFAALPLFLIWLQLSWYIVLLGAELAFAHQNVHRLEPVSVKKAATQARHRLIALGVMHAVVKHFRFGRSPSTPEMISKELNLPAHLVEDALSMLVQSRIAAAVIDPQTGKTAGYQPAYPPERYTIQYVIDTLEGNNQEALADIPSESMKSISEKLRKMLAAAESSPENVRLAEL